MNTNIGFDVTGLRVLSVSYETVRKIWNEQDASELTARRYGRVVMEKKHAPRLKGVITVRPLERVEIDNFLLDVHVVCPKTGVRLGRPWLTLAIDHYSGMALGYHLAFAPPSSASILATLRHAILPKGATRSEDSRKYDGHSAKAKSSDDLLGVSISELESANPCMGVMDFIAVDNGLDLTSYGFREACSSLSIEVGFMPPRIPWYKGVIERFGGTLNIRVIHWLPGTTLGGKTEGLDYDPRKESTITYTDLEGLVARYVHTVHPLATHRDKPGTPIRRWKEGVKEWPIRLPASRDDFDAIFALTVTRALGQDGVRYFGLHYHSEKLATIRNRVGEPSQVVCKIDPSDIRSIHVLDPRDDTPLRVPCTTEFSVPRSLALHRMARTAARLRGRDPDDAYELAQAERNLRRALEEAARRGKKTLRRMEAALLAKSAEDDGDFAAKPVNSMGIASVAQMSMVDELLKASRTNSDGY